MTRIIPDTKRSIKKVRHITGAMPFDLSMRQRFLANIVAPRLGQISETLGGDLKAGDRLVVEFAIQRKARP